MTSSTTLRARTTTDAVAAAPPSKDSSAEPLRPQSLIRGAAGIALLHIERAASGPSTWECAHAWLTAAAREGAYAGAHASLFFGSPALNFAFLATGQPGNYTKALAALEVSTAAITRARLSKAHDRIDRGLCPAFAEFDLIYGLTGLGALHLRQDPHGELARGVLAYLVRLTEPIGPDRLPGWWTELDPAGQESPRFPGGHGNFGMAHGITGPLALMSTAIRRGVVVPGQADAILRICQWLDHWRQDGPTGTWWPEWITRAELRRQQANQAAPARPSWCYGTPGLARAQQLAAIALGDPDRQAMAERSVISCLADPLQQSKISDGGLCHGTAGLFQTLWRMAGDAKTEEVADTLAPVLARLLDEPTQQDPGFLEGSAGQALALHTAASQQVATGWDASLLLD